MVISDEHEEDADPEEEANLPLPPTISPELLPGSNKTWNFVSLVDSKVEVEVIVSILSINHLNKSSGI